MGEVEVTFELPDGQKETRKVAKGIKLRELKQLLCKETPRASDANVDMYVMGYMVQNDELEKKLESLQYDGSVIYVEKRLDPRSEFVVNFQCPNHRVYPLSLSINATARNAKYEIAHVLNTKASMVTLVYGGRILTNEVLARLGIGDDHILVSVDSHRKVLLTSVATMMQMTVPFESKRTGKVHLITIPPDALVGFAKTALAEEIRTNEDVINLYSGDVLLEDDKPVKDYTAEAGITFEVVYPDGYVEEEEEDENSDDNVF